MILADKIINLRKKNGWSQEELAHKLGVSRQSVSKYEGAQAVPDLDKILKLSQIFGVTTDYLIKDEMEEEIYTGEDSYEEDKPQYKVTMEMASDFLQIIKEAAKRIAFATWLCVISPICLIVLGAASEVEAFGIGEDFAGGVGMCVMFILVGIAVAIFVCTDMKQKKFEFLETKCFETEYGVTGMVKERKEQFHERYVRYNVIGVTLCIFSVIPLFGGIAIFGDRDFPIVCMVGIMLFLISCGVYFFVLGGTQMAAMEKLLEEGDYTRAKKKISDKMGAFSLAYWLGSTAIFLGISFITNDWKDAGIVWPIVGVLYAAVRVIVEHVCSKEK